MPPTLLIDITTPCIVENRRTPSETREPSEPQEHELCGNDDPLSQETRRKSINHFYPPPIDTSVYFSQFEAIVERLQAEIQKRVSLIKMDELKSRKRILRRFKFCSETDVLETKGRMACEISTGDELMLTELMLAGDFSSLTDQQLVAFLSCFVFEDMVKNQIEPQEDLHKSLEKMRDLARHISRISKECRLDVYPAIDESNYVDSFKVGLVELVRAWAKGSTFAKLCENTEIYEGSMIRSIRRLDELLGQLYEAARVIGNIQLEKKFGEGIALLFIYIIDIFYIYID